MWQCLDAELEKLPLEAQLLTAALAFSQIADILKSRAEVLLQDTRDHNNPKVDIHLQDYVNYKDAILLDRNGIRERIEHKWQRTEDEFAEVKASIKELEGFLQKKNDFRIRE